MSKENLQNHHVLASGAFSISFKNEHIQVPSSFSLAIETGSWFGSLQVQWKSSSL